jgi:hypothetical protein
MTVESPEWDSNLSGHSAIELTERQIEICHAVIGSFENDGTPTSVTECGLDVQEKDILPREEFVESNSIMCRECWPDEVIER